MSLGLIPARRLTPEPGPQQVCDLEPSQVGSPHSSGRTQRSSVVSILWLLLRYHLWAALFTTLLKVWAKWGREAAVSVQVNFLLSVLGTNTLVKQ